MIRDRLILCVASRWDLDPTSKHHVMRRLSRRNDVLWVNFHGTRRPTLRPKDLRNALTAFTQSAAGLRPIHRRMAQTTPLIMPAVRHGWWGHLNRGLVTRQIDAALHAFRPDHRLPLQLWTFAPDVAFLAEHFKPERFVYYCVDEFSQFEGFDAENMRGHERELLQKADVVITSSRALYEAKTPLHPNVHLVRHGVDVKHFARALTPGLPLPAPLQNLHRPILGFFGLVHSWVDLELIAEVARRCAPASVVLIGEVFADVSALRILPNVHFLGRQPYARLPSFCAAFDVAILPFKCNEMTRFVNPIKQREYVAAGLPVVATPIPEVTWLAQELARRNEGADRENPVIHVTADPAEFTAACLRLAASNTADTRRRRAATVASDTWEATVEQVCAAVTGDASAAAHPVPAIPADLHESYATARAHHDELVHQA